MAINNYTYRGPTEQDRQNELLAQFLHGAQGASQAELNSGLEQTKNKADISNAQAMAKANPGSAVSTDRTSINPMPSIKQAQQANQVETQALNKAYGLYNSGAKGLSGKLDTLEEATNVLSKPNQMTLGTMRSLVLRASGLNRFNDEEAKNLVPPTAQGAFSRIGSWAGGDSQSVTPSQIKDASEFFNGVANSVKTNHEALKQQALQQYSSMPGANPNRLQDVAQVGKPVDDRLANVTKSLSSFQESPQTMGAASTENTQGGILGALKAAGGGLHSFFLGNQPAPSTPTGASPAPQNPTGNAASAAAPSNLQDAFAAELARRKASRGQ